MNTLLMGFGAIAMGISPFIAAFATIRTGAKIRRNSELRRTGLALMLLPFAVFLWFVLWMFIVAPSSLGKELYMIGIPVGPVIWLPVILAFISTMTLLLFAIFHQVERKPSVIASLLCLLTWFCLFQPFAFQ
ncbi:MAG: hypothetical protein ACRBBS_00915 [Thalassovita sp.]